MQYKQDESNQDQIHESKGLFIPIEILNDKNLSHGEKILLSQIYWYDQFTECHASNKHLANLMNMNIRGLQKMIKKLKDKEYLNSNGLCNRVLRLNHVQMDTPCPEGHVQMDTPCPNGRGNHVQMDTPIKKSIKKYIIYNTTIGKIENISSQDILCWQRAYPNVNIKNEILQAAEWCKANPKKIQGRKDLRRTLVNWFAREQDKNEAFKKPKPKAQPKPESTGITVAQQWETKKKHGDKIDEYRKGLIDSGKHSDSSIQHMVDDYIQDLWVKEMD